MGRHACPNCATLTWGYGSPNISPLCSSCYIQQPQYTFTFTRYIVNNSGAQPIPTPTHRIPMPQSYNNHAKEALLIYEEVLQAYKFKFVRGFSRSVIDIIKAGIPTNERTTSGPPDWEWYFKEQYYPLIKLALDGAGFVTKVITREDIEKLKAQQAEQQAQNQNKVPNYGQMFKPKAYSIEDELDKFYHLLNPVWESAYGFLTLKALKEWDRTTAIKFYRIAAGFWHPDKGGDAKRMSELNTTWAILKEGYYIK